MRFVFIFLLCSLINISAIAEAVSMQDFRMLRRGMNEAEILYRLGAYDHETVITDYYHNVTKKTWFYIPGAQQFSNQKWITEITFDRNGLVQEIDRYRPEN